MIGAVRHVSIDIREGEIFIIMGLSGSGKSTLVRCMSRLIEPTAGSIEFDGKDLLKATPSRADRDPPPQDGHGVPAFRPAAASDRAGQYRLSAVHPGHRPATREARARKMIELVGLKGREHFYPRELSGGQQQRVGIARSLAVKPEIWFLDEPFSALDPLIRREMQDELMRLQNVLQEDDRLHHPRFRRGDPARRPHRHHEGWRDHPDRHAGGSGDTSGDRLCREFTRDVQRAKVIRRGG